MGRDEPESQRIAADLALVRSAQDGQAAALSGLAKRLRCVPRILHSLNRRRGNLLVHQDLEDLSQDVVIVVLRRLERYRGQAPLECWIHRIAFFEFMNLLRTRNRAASLIKKLPDEDWDVDRLEAPAIPDPLEFEFVEELLNRLDETSAAIIRLKHYQEMTFQEIGEVLTMSPNSAKTRYYRSTVELERLLVGKIRGSHK